MFSLSLLSLRPFYCHYSHVLPLSTPPNLDMCYHCPLKPWVMNQICWMKKFSVFQFSSGLIWAQAKRYFHYLATLASGFLSGLVLLSRLVLFSVWVRITSGKPLILQIFIKYPRIKTQFRFCHLTLFWCRQSDWHAAIPYS